MAINERSSRDGIVKLTCRDVEMLILSTSLSATDNQTAFPDANGPTILAKYLPNLGLEHAHMVYRVCSTACNDSEWPRLIENESQGATKENKVIPTLRVYSFFKLFCNYHNGLNKSKAMQINRVLFGRCASRYH